MLYKEVENWSVAGKVKQDQEGSCFKLGEVIAYLQSDEKNIERGKLLMLRKRGASLCGEGVQRWPWTGAGRILSAAVGGGREG